MDLKQAMMASASGLQAQSTRMRVISENLANAGTQASEPGGDPYRRKLITFKAELDRANEVTLVKSDKVVHDQSDFGKKYDPGNPAADQEGYIKTTNVNSMVEMMDMQQAQRSYRSNLNAMESARRMASQTVELLR